MDWRAKSWCILSSTVAACVLTVTPVNADGDPICVTDAKTGKHRCTVSTEGGEDYDGEWGKSGPDGLGTYVNDGLEYVGEFKNGRFHGRGKVTCIHPEYREFEGTFVDGSMDEGRVISNPGSGSKILLQDYPMCRQ